MSVKTISKDELRRMEGSEGLILQGCGGSLDEWVDGINDMLTEDGILLNGTRFHDCSTFEHDGSTCLLFPFKDDVELDVGKLAMWRLQTHGNFGGTWLSDYVPNKLGGFISKEQTAEAVQKPDCPLIGQDGNIFNLMGIASRTLKQNGLADQAKKMCDRIRESGDYGKQAIANKLNEESVPRRHGTKLWYAFGIDYMLNNERYMGDALLQKKYTTDTLPFKKVKNRGERPKYYVENANPAIVSRETYSAVQELQKSRQKNVGGKKTSYPLTGMLRCPGCGRTYRRQLVRGKAYWMCSGRASGATICSSQRMSESDVYEAFNRMLFKLKEHHHAILGALIRDIEVMQSKTSENHEKIVEIDKEIADLAARNLVIVRLHTSGILNGSDYAAQSSEINNKISALRSERKRKLAEDEGNEQLDKLKELQGILDEYEPTKAFDEDLFHQIIEKAVVMSKSEIAFHLIGGLKLTETIA